MKTLHRQIKIQTLYHVPQGPTKTFPTSSLNFSPITLPLNHFVPAIRIVRLLFKRIKLFVSSGTIYYLFLLPREHFLYMVSWFAPLLHSDLCSYAFFLK